MVHLVATQPAAAPDTFVDNVTHLMIVAVVVLVVAFLVRLAPDVTDVLLIVRSVVVAVVVVTALAFAVFAITVGVGALASVTH